MLLRSNLLSAVNRRKDFGRAVKLLSRNSNIRKFDNLPKFAGKNSIYVSFKYNSLKLTKLVKLSGTFSNILELRSKTVNFWHLCILFGISEYFKPETISIQYSFYTNFSCITVSANV